MICKKCKKETDELLGVFGMDEMECAAKRIMKLCAVTFNQKFGIDDMETDRERTGFVELLYSGFIDKTDCHYNGEFHVSKSFIDRVYPLRTFVFDKEANQLWGTDKNSMCCRECSGASDVQGLPYIKCNNTDCPDDLDTIYINEEVASNVKIYDYCYLPPDVPEEKHIEYGEVKIEDYTKLTLKEMVHVLREWCHSSNYVFDDIVDRAGLCFKNKNGDEVSMYDKFEEDTIDFIEGYRYRKGEK